MYLQPVQVTCEQPVALLQGSPAEMAETVVTGVLKRLLRPEKVPRENWLEGPALAEGRMCRFEHEDPDGLFAGLAGSIMKALMASAGPAGPEVCAPCMCAHK